MTDVAIYLAGCIGAAMIWGLRLEGKVKGLEREHELIQTAVKAIESSHNSLSIKVVEQLGNIREALARIEERIGRD